MVSLLKHILVSHEDATRMLHFASMPMDVSMAVAFCFDTPQN